MLVQCLEKFCGRKHMNRRLRGLRKSEFQWFSAGSKEGLARSRERSPHAKCRGGMSRSNESDSRTAMRAGSIWQLIYDDWRSSRTLPGISPPRAAFRSGYIRENNVHNCSLILSTQDRP